MMHAYILLLLGDQAQISLATAFFGFLPRGPGRDAFEP